MTINFCFNDHLIILRVRVKKKEKIIVLEGIKICFNCFLNRDRNSIKLFSLVRLIGIVVSFLYIYLFFLFLSLDFFSGRSVFSYGN